MSTYRKDKQICCVCGKKNDVMVLASTNSFGSMDLDTRQPERARTDQLYNAQECKNCGYVSYDLSQKTKIKQEFLKTDKYKKCDNIEFVSEFSKMFYKMYLIDLENKKNKNAFWSLMRCIWSTDDANDTKNAIELRKKCIELFDTLKLNKTQKQWSLIKIDLLRRSRQFDECESFIKELKDNEELLNEIYKYNTKEMIDEVISFQLELCNKEDDKCYNVKKQPLKR